VSDELIIKKLNKIFYECDKHIVRIESSCNELKSIMPLDTQSYINLTEEEIKVLDQFLFRFSKLQDAMGQRLFKTIMYFLKEDIDGKPFIDILNMMEKISLLESSNVWKDLREDRNKLVYSYEDKPDEMSEAINKLYNKKDVLINIYLHIKNYYLEKHEKL
jgi:hypothetical protein